MADSLPNARTQQIILRELDSEIIYYDLKRLKAGSLNSLATEVLKLCDGSRTPAQISAAIGRKAISEQEVCCVLEKLSKANLLADGYRPSDLRFGGISRRAALAKLAIGGVPLVATIAVPSSAQAASCIAPQNMSNDCLQSQLGMPCCKILPTDTQKYCKQLPNTNRHAYRCLP